MKGHPLAVSKCKVAFRPQDSEQAPHPKATLNFADRLQDKKQTLGDRLPSKAQNPNDQ